MSSSIRRGILVITAVLILLAFSIFVSKSYNNTPTEGNVIREMFQKIGINFQKEQKARGGFIEQRILQSDDKIIRGEITFPGGYVEERTYTKLENGYILPGPTKLKITENQRLDNSIITGKVIFWKEFITGKQIVVIRPKKCIIPKSGMQVDGQGGVVEICPGTYTISAPGLTITGPTILEGNGAEIITDSPLGYNIGIKLKTDNVTIKNVKLTNWGYGIDQDASVISQHSKNIIIENNTFETWQGIRLKSVGNSKIIGNILKVVGGIQVTYSENYIQGLFEEIEIRNNQITLSTDPDAGLSGGGITVFTDREKVTLNNITVENNSIIYNGCANPLSYGIFSDFACYTFALLLDRQTTNATISNNNLTRIIGNAIEIRNDEESNLISDNFVSLETNGYHSTQGIVKFTTALIPLTSKGPIVKNNFIKRYGHPPYMVGSIYGALVTDLFEIHGEGPIRFQNNTFEKLLFGFAFIGNQVDNPVYFYENNLIDNYRSINDPDHNFGSLVIDRNYYSDWIGPLDCNPDTIGYCQNPYTWNNPSNYDPYPKSTPIITTAHHLECQSSMCVPVVGSGTNQCITYADC